MKCPSCKEKLTDEQRTQDWGDRLVYDEVDPKREIETCPFCGQCL